MDEGLAHNLASFFELDYPEYEILFSIADQEDEAREIVEALIQKYPGIDAKLMVGGSHVGENPKVNNIYNSYKLAKYDLILISDSNIRVKKSYLKQLAAEMKEGVSLVTACIAGRFAKSAGGWLEANYLNTYLNRWMHLSYFVDHPIVLGKSMLFRRGELEKIGGLKKVSNQIAEDYATARLMQKHRRKIVLLRDPVSQYLGKFSFKSFWARHVRWGRIRKSCSYFEFLIEPVSGVVVSGALGAFSLQYFFDLPVMPTFWGYAFYWAVQDLYLIRNRGEKIGMGALLIWWAYECLTIPIWVHALVGKTIQWRGNRLKLGEGGRLLPFKEEGNDPFLPELDEAMAESTQEMPRRKMVSKK